MNLVVSWISWIADLEVQYRIVVYDKYFEDEIYAVGQKPLNQQKFPPRL